MTQPSYLWWGQKPEVLRCLSAPRTRACGVLRAACALRRRPPSFPRVRPPVRPAPARPSHALSHHSITPSFLPSFLPSWTTFPLSHSQRQFFLTLLELRFFHTSLSGRARERARRRRNSTPAAPERDGLPFSTVGGCPSPRSGRASTLFTLGEGSAAAFYSFARGNTLSRWGR